MRAFVGRVSYLSLANVINGVLSVVFIPFAVARLGEVGYGLFSIYVLLAGYAPLIDIGVGKNLVRLLGSAPSDAERRDDLRLALGAYVGLLALALLALPAVGWLVAHVIFPVAPEHRPAVVMMVLLAVAEYGFGIPVALRQNLCVARERFDRIALFMVLSGVSRYVLGFAALLLAPAPLWVAGAFVARRGIELAVTPRVLTALPPGSWRPRFGWQALRSMVGHSAVLSLAQFTQLTVVSIGSVLVNARFGLAALGIYRAVLDLATRVFFVSNAVGAVVFPGFVRLWSRDDGRRRLGEVMPATLQVSWVAFAALAATAAVLAPVVLPLLGFGAADYLRLFGLVMGGVCLMAHSNLAYEFLQATGWYRQTLLLAAGALVLMVVIFLAVAPSGLVAVGWAWFVSQAAFAGAADATALRRMGAAARDWRTVGVRLLGVAGALMGALAALGVAPGRWGTGAGLVLVAALAAVGPHLRTVTRLVRYGPSRGEPA